LKLNHSNPNLPAFNKSLFTQETLGTLGNCPLASFSGPGLVNFDMALLKVVAIKEGKSLQFRSEAYNVFNSAQFFISANGQPARRASQFHQSSVRSDRGIHEHPYQNR
jgi:hypothetical protein